MKPGSPRRQAAEAHIAEAFQWFAENQKGRGAQSKWNYRDGATYMSGNPYLMYTFARYLPRYGDQVAEGDKELRYVTGLLYEKGKKPRATKLQVWELMTWAMMSYAERLRPGRSSARRTDTRRPALEHANPTLILQGDDHDYNRSTPLRGIRRTWGDRRTARVSRAGVRNRTIAGPLS